MIPKIFLLLIAILTWFCGMAQQKVNHSFTVNTQTFKQNNKVYVRWTLKNAKEWRLANEKGFIIERIEDGATTYQQLNSLPIKPITEQAALKYGTKSNIYSLIKIANTKPDYTKPNANQNDENVYPLFLLLSSYAPINASLSACGFIDSTIQPPKKYTYKVYVANENIANQHVVTANVHTNSTTTALPIISGLFGDKTVNLSWNIKSVINEYPAVIVERSTDSVLFYNITNQPLLTSLSQDEENAGDTSKQLMFYKDETAKNNVKYYYRIKGINFFGIESKPSNVVVGECIPTFKSVPKILYIDTLATKFVITWSIIDSLKPYIQHYELWSSETGSDTSFAKVTQFAVKNVVGNLQHAFSYKPKETNYFIIKAITKKEKIAIASMPYLYLLKDSTPPAKPTKIVANISTDGTVQLIWEKNNELDFKGYKVYRSITSPLMETFTAINTNPITEASFKEKVPLKQTNRNIYYRITALDNKYNESGLSEFILVKRPDVIPPTSPIVKKILLQNNYKSAQLIWGKSFSKDVRNYTIFRKKYSDTTDASWQLISTLNNTDTSFTDNTIEPYTWYNYKIQAIDSSDLKSNFSTVVTLYAPQKPEKIKTISNLNSYVSREKKYIELNWNVPNADILEIVIYRVENRNEEQIVLLATVPASTKIYDDEKIKENTLYTYYLKPVFKTGKSGDFVKIDVDY